jgi:hypothetical protein
MPIANAPTMRSELRPGSVLTRTGYCLARSVSGCLTLKSHSRILACGKHRAGFQNADQASQGFRRAAP